MTTQAESAATSAQTVDVKALYQVAAQLELLPTNLTIEQALDKITTQLRELIQNGGQVESDTKGQVQSKKLSSEESVQLFSTMEERFKTPNSLRPAGITFVEIKQMLEADQNLAYRVYVGEVLLGQEMDYVHYEEGRSNFDGLRSETNPEKDVAFLGSIPVEEREKAIKSLREQYPHIPKNAFERLPEDNSGPNKWEDKLIQKVTGLKSIPEKDYLTLQGKLPKGKWLDVQGISWLEEESEAQLASGRAPRGDRDEVGVRVNEGGADYRGVIRGVRVRA